MDCPSAVRSGLTCNTMCWTLLKCRPAKTHLLRKKWPLLDERWLNSYQQKSNAFSFWNEFIQLMRSDVVHIVISVVFSCNASWFNSSELFRASCLFEWIAIKRDLANIFACFLASAVCEASSQPLGNVMLFLYPMQFGDDFQLDTWAS